MSISQYGFDQYPLIAKHPINAAITLRSHPNGPVIYDADSDTMSIVSTHVLRAIYENDAPTAGGFEADWIAMALFRENKVL